jgi:hypothetical protein
VQTPLWQVSPDGHWAPQAPQLKGSLSRVAQTPKQQLSPEPQSLSVLHVEVHAPATHHWPAGQVTPSSMAPLQSLSMPSQTSVVGTQAPGTHWPLWQTWPGAQSVSVLHPVVPQSCGQLCAVSLQEASQTPLPHAHVEPQSCGQLCALSPHTGAHTPSPQEHDGAAQAPLTQTWPPVQSESVAHPAGDVQAPITQLPPPAQVAPLSTTPSQSLSIPSQTSAVGVHVLVGRQAPPWQVSPPEQSLSAAQISAQKLVVAHTSPLGQSESVWQAMGA